MAFRLVTKKLNLPSVLVPELAVVPPAAPPVPASVPPEALIPPVAALAPVLAPALDEVPPAAVVPAALVCPPLEARVVPPVLELPPRTLVEAEEDDAPPTALELEDALALEPAWAEELLPPLLALLDLCELEPAAPPPPEAELLEPPCEVLCPEALELGWEPPPDPVLLPAMPSEEEEQAPMPSQARLVKRAVSIHERRQFLMRFPRFIGLCLALALRR
jgi:hypothetical protein